MVFAMADKIASAVVTTGDAGYAAADSGNGIQFKSGAFQITKMSVLQGRGVMTDRTTVSFILDMFPMPAG